MMEIFCNHNEKSTHANPVLIFCQNKNNKKTDMRKIVSFFQNILAFTLKFMLQRYILFTE